MLEVEGPPHDRHFVCAALIDGEELGPGTGRSKKDAEQAAAKQALAALGASPEASRSAAARIAAPVRGAR